MAGQMYNGNDDDLITENPEENAKREDLGHEGLKAHSHQDWHIKRWEMGGRALFGLRFQYFSLCS